MMLVWTKRAEIGMGPLLLLSMNTKVTLVSLALSRGRSIVGDDSTMLARVAIE
jgi:hypothetical protein